MSGSNPPSTSGSPCLARRARLTAGVAVLAITALVVTVATTAGASSNHPSTATASPSTSWRETRAELLHARTAAGGTIESQATSATRAAIVTGPLPAAPPIEAPTPPPPAPTPPRSASGDPADPATWDHLASCESGSSWAADTGNGYYGGLQFSLSSWRAVGGVGYPHEHTRDTQIEMGRRLFAQGGWSHWPSCTRSFGWPQ